MTLLFGHFWPKTDQMTQNNAPYSNKQNVPYTYKFNLQNVGEVDSTQTEMLTRDRL